MSPRPLDLDAVLQDPATRTIVCCGAGGVGKTTVAASVAIRAAEQGRHAVVLTIDPARRLAQSLGLKVLDNSPAPVAGIDDSAGGSLEAMMLDMKRTFDEVIEANASPAAAQQILANPFYQSLSSSFAGTQEYMAMEKLGQLQGQAERDRAAGHPAWDLIVVDTPPSRSALDFLDAPARLGSFLDSRFVKLLTAPARVGGRMYLKLMSGVMGTASSIMNTVLGTALITDLQTFLAAMDSMFGGFRQRAESTYRLLKAPGTVFLVVASPETDTLNEATYFMNRLAADGIPLAGLVVNRVAGTAAPELTSVAASAAAGQLAGQREHRLAASVLNLHAATASRAERQAGLIARFTATHPSVAMVCVPARSTEVHDLEALRDLGRDLCEPTGSGELSTRPA